MQLDDHWGQCLISGLELPGGIEAGTLGPPPPHPASLCAACSYGQTTLFLSRCLVHGLLLKGGGRFFGGNKDHFRYHQDGEDRHKHKNISAESTQVEVFHGHVIDR